MSEQIAELREMQRIFRRVLDTLGIYGAFREDDLIELVKAARGGGSSLPVHRCSGCGHRWHCGPAKACEWTGAELCGDCWRTAQPVLHAAASSQVTPSTDDVKRHPIWLLANRLDETLDCITRSVGLKHAADMAEAAKWTTAEIRGWLAKVAAPSSPAPQPGNSSSRDEGVRE